MSEDWRDCLMDFWDVPGTLVGWGIVLPAMVAVVVTAMASTEAPVRYRPECTAWAQSSAFPPACPIRDREPGWDDATWERYGYRERERKEPLTYTVDSTGFDPDTCQPYHEARMTGLSWAEWECDGRLWFWTGSEVIGGKLPASWGATNWVDTASYSTYRPDSAEYVNWFEVRAGHR